MASVGRERHDQWGNAEMNLMKRYRGDIILPCFGNTTHHPLSAILAAFHPCDLPKCINLRDAWMDIRLLTPSMTRSRVQARW